MHPWKPLAAGCRVIAVNYAPPYFLPSAGGRPCPDRAARAHRMGEAAEVLIRAGLEAALETAGLRVDGVVRLGAPCAGAGPQAGVEALTRRVAREVNAAVQEGLMPVVLDDCCSTVGGVAGLAQAAASAGRGAAARRPERGAVPEGAVGLVWLDAHADFNTPETSPSGYLGGMPLAVITGRGNEWWRSAAGGGLPLPEERIALAGVRPSAISPGGCGSLTGSSST